MTTFKPAVRNNARRFFKQLGLVEMSPEAAERITQKVGGPGFMDRAEAARNRAHKTGDWQAFYELIHSDQQVFAAMTFHDLPRVMQAAELIARMTPVPGMRVLDLGGGPGQLAFWTAEVWPQAHVTVLDPYGAKLGEKWARQLRTDRVTFETGGWQDLTPEQHGPYDFAVVSSVLRLHAAAPAFADEANFQPDQPEDGPLTAAQERGILDLRAFLERVTPVMDPESSLLLMEAWTPSSARLLALALEGTEWGFDVAWCAPSRLGERAVSLFMLSRGSTGGREYVQAAANSLTLPAEMQELTSAAALSFRRVFNGEVQGRLSVRYHDGHTMYVEIFEGEGLGGVYEQATNGYSRVLWGSLFHRAQYHSVIAGYTEAVQSGEVTLLEATGPLFTASEGGA